MTFKQFIDYCSSYIPKHRLFFTHMFFYDHHFDKNDQPIINKSTENNSYKCEIIGVSSFVIMSEKYNIIQFYEDQKHFENCSSLHEAMKKLKEELNNEN